MAVTDTVGETVSVFNVKPGDIIRDDIACLVVSVSLYAPYGVPDEVSIFLEDGNGYYYMIRRSGGVLTRYDWTPEEWAAYRAL